MRPVLVVVGGLPATGKSTIARILAEQCKAPYLRVDRIEHEIVAWSALSHPLGAAGYAVAYELAQEQLQLRLDVIVECVNPVALTRDSWSKIAAKTARRFLKWRLSARMNPSIVVVSRLVRRMSKGYGSRRGRRSWSGSTSPGGESTW